LDNLEDRARGFRSRGAMLQGSQSRTCSAQGKLSFHYQLLEQGVAKMTNHGFVSRHTPHHQDGSKRGCAFEECVHDVLRYSQAQAIADGLQTVAFLLGVSQVGFGEYGAAGSDLGRCLVVCLGQSGESVCAFEIEPARLLIQEAAGTGRAKRV